jgi:hypothetical protein
MFGLEKVDKDINDEDISFKDFSLVKITISQKIYNYHFKRENDIGEKVYNKGEYQYF